MTNQRYDMRKDEDGTWTVFDIRTDRPASVKGVPQFGLEMDQADDLVDLLNLLHVRGKLGLVELH